MSDEDATVDGSVLILCFLWLLFWLVDIALIIFLAMRAKGVAFCHGSWDRNLFTVLFDRV
jgi:hypothetical protein